MKANERELKAEFFTGIKTLQFTDQDLELFKSKVNNKRKIKNFREEEFIVLRSIMATDKASFYLVIHVESLYVFMMKKIGDQKEMIRETEHEIYFDENFSHRCLAPFYGFLKKGDKTIGFIYEYMCNDSLKSFVSSNPDKVDDTFILLAINRIIQGIDYLHSNKLIHRDLKPSKILIDHDFLPYVSDFDSIRHPKEEEKDDISELMTNDIGSMTYSSPEQFQGLDVSYPTDIYSLGLLIYYLYEKKYLYSYYGTIRYIKKDDEIPSLSHAPSIIQALFTECLKFNTETRITNHEIRLKYCDNFFTLICQQLSLSKATPAKDQLIFESFIVSNNLMLYISNIVFLFTSKNVDPYLYVGTIYDFKRDYIKAIEYYEISAKHNDSYALNSLGNIYYCGHGVKQDNNKAKKYYELSAKQNNSYAFVNLGNLYYNECGVKQDYNKAKEYYEISAKQNNSDALNSLGNIYASGYGVRQDYNKAKEYYELSANQNNSNAIFNLGNHYYYGYGVKQDYNKAKEYYEISANQNNSYALNGLGALYFDGYGVKRDINKAKEYLELSAKQNNSSAFNSIGALYYYGEGVKRDYNKAKKYFELSANQNNSHALFFFRKSLLLWTRS